MDTDPFPTEPSVGGEGARVSGTHTSGGPVQKPRRRTEVPGVEGTSGAPRGSVGSCPGSGTGLVQGPGRGRGPSTRVGHPSRRSSRHPRRGIEWTGTITP